MQQALGARPGAERDPRGVRRLRRPPLGDHQRAGRARSSAGPTSRSRCTSWRRAWSTYPVLELGQRRAAPGRCCRPTPATASPPARAALMEPRFNFDVSELATTATRATARLRAQRRQVLRAARRRGASTSLVYARGERGPRAPSSCRAARPACTVGEREQNMGLKAPGDLRAAARGLHACRPRRAAAAATSRRCSTARASRWRRSRSASRAPPSSTRATTPRSARAFGVAIAPEAGDRLHARRDGDRDRRHAPAHLGSGVEARPRRGRDARGLPGEATTPPTWRSRSPTTPSRCSAATATSATTWSSSSCATARGFAVFEGLAMA